MPYTFKGYESVLGGSWLQRENPLQEQILWMICFLLLRGRLGGGAWVPRQTFALAWLLLPSLPPFLPSAEEAAESTMEEVESWVPVVGFTLLPNAGSLWGARIVKREIPTWYKSLEKPSWNPPNWVFAPVWASLYSSMGYGSYLVWKELGGFNEKSMVPLGLYAGNLALNWSWVPIFFGKHKKGWGLVTILLTTGAATLTTTAWYHVNKTAAYLMYPYLAWLTFASVLNYRLWKDNPDKKH